MGCKESEMFSPKTSRLFLDDIRDSLWPADEWHATYFAILPVLPSTRSEVSHIATVGKLYRVLPRTVVAVVESAVCNSTHVLYT